ncbi:response regulator [Aquabacterium fontiphilum]|uniref:ATP-binding protein n=1 Tax=Aquabacterium fontiphilum TaxID=450365 RepID=UPI0013779F23|nr:ATP-binding protein [Aquabacterium fontiphilum]NBD20840.1 response regulator [Aquabacterium fontiphilum]
MQLLRLSLSGLPPDDRAIYIEQLREHWRLDVWTVPGQLLALLALSPVILGSGLKWWAWLGPVALLLASWAWAVRAPARLRRVTLDEASYSRWRRRTLLRELAQSLGWALLAAALWGALDEQWHLLILTGLLVFTYTAMFFSTHDTGVAAVASVPILLTMQARLWWSDGAGHGTIALILAASMLTCLFVGRLVEQRLFEGERLRRRNQALVRSLEHEMAQLSQARDAAQQANQHKSAFLAAASHDLRQPLHSLTLLSGVMARTADAPTLQATAQRMQSAIDGLRFVFDQLFDIARLDAGKQPPRPQALSVDAVLSALSDEMAPLCEAKGLRWQCLPAAGMGCMADPVYLQRSLRNLLDNALRYTAQGGVLLRARRRGPHVVLQVWDTGPGIARDWRARIFDDHVQGHNAQRLRSEGLGLGLAVVRRMAEAGGYRIDVRSRPGRGSCFALWLPACPPPKPAPGPAWGSLTDSAGGPTPDAPPIVVIVEDDPDVRDALARLLPLAGWAVAAGATCEEAVEAVAALGRMPHVALCDHRLAGPDDGLAVIARLRHEFGRALPAGLLTGDLDAGLPARCAAEEVVLARKPLRDDALLSLLRTLITPR